MIVTTTDTVAGYDVDTDPGLVRGNTVRARDVAREVTQGIRDVAGGELKGDTTLLSAAREEAVDRMLAEAEALDADAVVEVRFVTAEVAQGAAEILAYGTAVRLTPAAGPAAAAGAETGSEAGADAAAEADDGART